MSQETSNIIQPATLAIQPTTQIQNTNHECQNGSLEVISPQIQLINTNAIDFDMYHTPVHEREVNGMWDISQSHVFTPVFMWRQRRSSYDYDNQSYFSIIPITHQINFQQLVQNSTQPRQNTTTKKLKLKRSQSNKHECSICIDRIRRNTKIPDLKCKHKFHKGCLEKWMECKTNCPLCRNGINE